jgi:hypothetical protein
MSEPMRSPETLSGLWRRKFAEARHEYAVRPTPETKLEYLRVLGIFAALVIHGVTPTENGKKNSSTYGARKNENQ